MSSLEGHHKERLFSDKEFHDFRIRPFNRLQEVGGDRQDLMITTHLLKRIRQHLLLG